MRIGTVVIVLAAGALTGCASQESSQDRTERAERAIEICRDHDGVVAFDDDAVICADQTFSDERGERAVEACREHDGVGAFDDDLVICRDATFHQVEGG